MQDKLAAVEEQISALETEKADLLARMNSQGFGEDAGLVLETSNKYNDVEASLEKAYSQWSDVSEELEKAEKRLESEE